MAMAIQVRTLDGQSTTVSISSDRTIGDLKVTLRESFLPAMRSPNFHLFFKGSKLSLDSLVNSRMVEHGEFLVFIPFTKKNPQISGECGPPVHSSRNRPPDSVAAHAADSAWRDIMNDLSSLSEISKAEITENNSRPFNEIPKEKEEALVGERCKTTPLKRRRKRKLDENNLLREILCSDVKSIVEQQISDKIQCVVESVSCLCNADSDICFLYKEYFKSSGVSQSCVCPSWLKRVLKNFTFLNILYALFQVQRKCLTWECIKEALKRPRIFGLENICVSDIERLSLLSPKVVISLCEQETSLKKADSAILIYISSDYQYEVRVTDNTKALTSSVMRAINHRNVAFRSDLCRALKCFMDRNMACGVPLVLPLEDVVSMEDLVAVSESSEVMSYRKMTSLCCTRQILEPAEMVEHLKKGIGKQGQIVHVEQIDGKEALYFELPAALTETVRSTLEGIGITRLYSHQAESIQASLSGKNVVVATSTSSGKSLCYNVPVLEALCKNHQSCAIYIFPTKALAQDQLRTLLKMTNSLNIGLTVGVYDGDTSQEERKFIRDNARLLITNPDMLHLSILPFHKKFQQILSNLWYIVIDETHIYKGAFGCHTAFILRRLQRICSHVYGSDPSFIFCTATSANPRDHAMELGNLQTLELIQNDGSPCGPKYFILWNPPILGQNALRSGMNDNHIKCITESSGMNDNHIKCITESRRASPIMEVAYLLSEMVRHGLRSIAFCKTRKLSELVLCYTRELLHTTAKDLVNSVYVYRGGYSPQERRKIEADLFQGKILGVAATNALELGIDVGHIDATIHLGFPGSVASLWQQAGRSGRRGRPSLAVYVAFESPLDQYFMKFPHKLYGRSIEYCQVDAHNQQVLEQHISCAAYELPLSLQYDEKYFGSGLNCAIVSLKNKGYLGIDACSISSPKSWHYIGPEERPSHVISIRAVETNRYKVVENLSKEVLEEIEESKAFFQVYEGAVYMHQGTTYLVKDLDLSERVAFCQKADLKYYTKTRDCTDVCVAGGELAYPPVKVSANVKTTALTNACTVTTKWFGFYRIWRSSNRIFDTVELNLPAFSFQSQAVWIRIPQSVKTVLETEKLPFRPGIHAASHALLNVVPLYIMCNATDLATECVNPHEKRAFAERLLLYDRHPGGIGITAQVQLLFRELLAAALELISTCSCLPSSGCPSCIQTLSCSEYNEVIHKEAAMLILKSIIEAEELYFGGK